MQIGERIYCDYQASTPIDKRVIEKMVQSMQLHWGNPHSNDHIWGWEAAKALESAMGQIRESLKLDTSDIYITSGATEANNLAILGFARGAAKDGKRRLSVAASEHKAVLEPALELRDNEGWEIDTIEVDKQGFIIEDSLIGSLEKGSSLVLAMAVNNEIGTIQRVDKVSELCTKYGALFHCDAVQSFGNRETLFKVLERADSVSISGHKIYGPKGVGALILRNKWKHLIRPLMYGGGQQEGLRPGTMPVHQIIGLAEAIKIWENESAEELANLKRLSNLFLTELTKKGVIFQLNGPEFSERHAGNVNIILEGIDGHEILGMLQPKIAASTGSACNSGIPGPSHVLTAIGLTPAQSNSSIRFSFGRFSDEKQIKSAVLQISDCITLLT